MRYKRILSMAGAVFAAACVDETPVEVVDEPIEQVGDVALAQQQEEEQGNFRARLEVGFAVRGKLAPDTLITVDLDGVAMEKILSGTVEVRLPTMAQMAAAGPGKRLGIITAVKAPVVARWQLPAMQAGDTWEESIEIGRIVEKGYYQMTVLTNTVGEFNSPYVNDNAYREAWLFITDHGGQVTNFLDHSIFPDNIVPQPGPFEAWGPGLASSSSIRRPP